MYSTTVGVILLRIATAWLVLEQQSPFLENSDDLGYELMVCYGAYSSL